MWMLIGDDATISRYFDEEFFNFIYFETLKF